MNQSSEGTISAYDLADMRGKVAGLLEDDVTSVSVTWCAKGARAYDPAGGQVGYAETRTTLSAWLGPVEDGEVEGAKAGDGRLLFVPTSLPSAAIIGDRWIDAEGIAWAVYHVAESPIEINVSAYGRKVS